MKIQPVIITCPGREQMLDLTLESFRSTDWTQSAPLISYDNSSFERLQQRQEQNSLNALKMAIERPADYYLFLEDDIEFNSHLEHNVKVWCWQRDIWLGSLYAPWEPASAVDGCDYEVPADRVYGSQAFLLSARLARYCVEHWYEIEGMQDIKISRHAGRGGKIFYHHPNLVQHAGQTSTWGGTIHTSPTFSKFFRSIGVHPRGYFLDDAHDGHCCDDALATSFCELFQGCRVHDLGCGNGEYVRRMKRAGIDAIGFDGNPVPFPQVVANVDLTLPFDPPWQADFVVSLEVGEHIPQQLEGIYLDNVCHCAKRGIVLSWAIPEQGGRCHINERPNDWVIGQLMERGWVRDALATIQLRSICQLPWLRHSLMVFQRTVFAQNSDGMVLRRSSGS